MRASTRRPWILASLLLLGGALAAAGAIRQHWLPCRGSMLSGSVLHGYAYGRDFSKSCLKAMDSGFGFVGSATAGQWSAELVFGTIAVVLLALSWTTVVVASGWTPRTRLLALLPAVATASTLVLNVGGVAETLGLIGTALLLAPNVLAVVAFVAIGLREEPGAAVMSQVSLVLGASTAVGLVPAIAEYAVMVWVSDANWDAPPGSGYLTVAMVALLALVLLVVTLGRGPSRPTAERTMATARA